MAEIITSLKNPKMKKIRLLAEKKSSRSELGLFVIEGVRMNEEAVASGLIADQIYFGETLTPRGFALINLFRNRSIDCEEVSYDVLKAISDTETPQGIVGVYKIPTQNIPNNPDFILILDNVRDPGNLGTILRSALAAGVQWVILTPGTCDPLSPKVLRSAMGAHFKLPITNMGWPELEKFASRVDFIVTEVSSESHIWNCNLTGPIAIVIGGEAEGISHQAKKIARKTVSIPMPGGTESLNAAVSASIIVFEVVRQRYYVNPVI